MGVLFGASASALTINDFTWSLSQCPDGTIQTSECGTSSGGGPDLPAGGTRVWDVSSTANASGTSSLGAFAVDKNAYVLPETTKQLVLWAWNTEITYLTADISNPPNRMAAFRVGAVNKASEGVHGTGEFTWSITQLPANGTLYDGNTEITTTPYDLGANNHPQYISDAAYEGTDEVKYRAVDPTGTSTEATYFIHVATAANYEMPVGFPADLCDFWGPCLTPDTPGDWSADVAGKMYVDGNQGDCVTSGVGNETTPLCGIDTVLTNNSVFSGDLIQLVAMTDGSCYELQSQGTLKTTFNGGTEAEPFFINGDPGVPYEDMPCITTNSARTTSSVWGINGSNIILRGVRLVDVRTDHRNSKDDGIDDDGFAIVNSACEGISAAAGNCFSPGTASTFASLSSGNNYEDPTQRVTRGGCFNSRFVDNGERLADFSEEQDVHGCTFGNNDNGYALDNAGWGNAGDFLQNTQNNNNGTIYIGGNDMHGDSENAIDIKAHENVIITNNYAADYRSVSYTGGSSGNGQAIVLNDDDEPAQSDNILVANNMVMDVNGQGLGITITGGTADVLNNVVLKVLGSQGNGIRVEKCGSCDGIVVAFNTVLDATRGMHSQPSGGDYWNFANYIGGATPYNVWMLSPSSHATFDWNFYEDTDAASQWQCCSNSGPVVRTGLSDWQSAATGLSLNAQMNISRDFRLNTPWDVRPLGTFGGLDEFTESEIEVLAPGFIARVEGLVGGDIPDIYGVPRTGNWTAGAMEIAD